MHEMSLASNLLELLRQEMEKHGATSLHEVRVCYGPLSNVVPDSLSFAFEALTRGTPWASARITLHQLPVRLQCCLCNTDFEPESLTLGQFAPCPQCGEELGHTVLQGKELYLDSIEVT